MLNVLHALFGSQRSSFGARPSDSAVGAELGLVAWLAAAVALVSTTVTLISIQGETAAPLSFVAKGIAIAGCASMAYVLYQMARVQRSVRLDWLAAGFGWATVVLTVRAAESLRQFGEPSGLANNVVALGLLWRVLLPVFAVGALSGLNRRVLAVFSGIMLIILAVLPVVPLSDVEQLDRLDTATTSKWIVTIVVVCVWALVAGAWIRETGLRPRPHEGWVSIALVVGAFSQLLWVAVDADAFAGWDSGLLVVGQFGVPGMGILASFGYQIRGEHRINQHLRETNVHLGQRLVAAEVRLEPLRAPAGTGAEADRVLAERDFTLVFQPIVEMASGEVVGLEALTRFADPPGWNPEEGFALATLAGCGTQLEIAVAEDALVQAFSFRHDCYVSINMSPSSVAAPYLAEVIERHRPGRIVVEITEQHAIDGYQLARLALEAQRARGLRIAIDDVGSGYGGLRHLVGLRPDIIKLDKTLVDGLGQLPNDALIAALTAFAGAVGATVVAEGVETVQEADALRTLGIEFAQGYLYARPMPIEQVMAFCAHRKQTTGRPL